MIPKQFNHIDQKENIEMHRYRVIEICSQDEEAINKSDIQDKLYNEQLLAGQIEKFRVKIHLSFIGPSPVFKENYGFYAGDELDRFILYYKDSQDKDLIEYFTLSHRVYQNQLSRLDQSIAVQNTRETSPDMENNLDTFRNRQDHKSYMQMSIDQRNRFKKAKTTNTYAFNDFYLLARVERF